MKREMIDMCEAFRNFLDESRAEGQSEGIVQGMAKGRIEGRAEGRAEGRTEGENTTLVKCVKTLMNKLQINATQSMDMLDVPQHQRYIIHDLLKIASENQ